MKNSQKDKFCKKFIFDIFEKKIENTTKNKKYYKNIQSLHWFFLVRCKLTINNKIYSYPQSHRVYLSRNKKTLLRFTRQQVFEKIHYNNRVIRLGSGFPFISVFFAII